MPHLGEATKWIMRQPFFSEIPGPEQNEAGSFVFMCTIFEYRLMETLRKDQNSSLSRSILIEYANSKYLPNADIKQEKAYFRNRFFQKDGTPTDIWETASFRPADRMEEIQRCLLDDHSAYEKDAEVLLRIVARLRNNLFHGFKWAYNLKGQKENFINANSILMKLMPPTH